MKGAALLLALTTPLAAQPAGIFAKDSKWEVVSEGHQFAEGMIIDSDNNLYFTDVPRSQLFRVDGGTGKRTLLDGETGRTNGIFQGPDLRIYGCASGDKQISAWDPGTWKKTAVAEGPNSNDIVVRKDGTIFFTDPSKKTVWRVTANERKVEPAAVLNWNPNGIGISRDHKTLFVAEFNSGNVHGFAIDDANSLGEDSVAFTLRVPADGKGQLDGLMIHVDGRLLIGTKLGIQIAAPKSPNRAAANPIVIPIPNDLPRCNYVRISPDGTWLYAAHAKAILRRALDPIFGKGL